MSVGGPLQGIRVIEMARLLPGPYCGMLLADLGAEVIKVRHFDNACYPLMLPCLLDIPMVVTF